jgi:Zn-finger nucleic acid-binding protein
MFAGMQFCPHCGAKAARIVDENTTLLCAGCRGQMRSVHVGSTALFECTACVGTWVDATTFAQLCANREERGTIAAMVAGPGLERAAPLGGAVHYLPCPACKKFMNRQNFGHVSGVIVDVCKGHGVWFERGELQAVMAFIDGGGLERARAHDAQKREDERQLDRIRESGPPPGVQYRSVEFHIESHQSGDSLLDEALRKLFS